MRLALTLQWDLPHGLLAGAALAVLLLKVDSLWVVICGVIISVVLFRCPTWVKKTRWPVAGPLPSLMSARG